MDRTIIPSRVYKCVHMHVVINCPPVVATALHSNAYTNKVLYGSAAAEKNVERIMDIALRRTSTVKLFVPGRSLQSKKSRCSPKALPSITTASAYRHTSLTLCVGMGNAMCPRFRCAAITHLSRACYTQHVFICVPSTSTTLYLICTHM